MGQVRKFQHKLLIYIDNPLISNKLLLENQGSDAYTNNLCWKSQGQTHIPTICVGNHRVRRIYQQSVLEITRSGTYTNNLCWKSQGQAHIPTIRVGNHKVRRTYQQSVSEITGSGAHTNNPCWKSQGQTHIQTNCVRRFRGNTAKRSAG